MSVVNDVERKVRARDKPRSHHGRLIRDAMLVLTANEALEAAKNEPLKDMNHRLAVRLLRRLGSTETT